MTARSRALFVALALFAFFLVCASLASETPARAARSPAPQPREQMQSAPEPEEPPGEEAQGEEEVGTEEPEGNDLEEEVTPPPLEPEPVPPTPSPVPAQPPAPPVSPAPASTPPVPTPPVAPPEPVPEAAGAMEGPGSAPPPSAVEPPTPPRAVAQDKKSHSRKGSPDELPANLRKICLRLGASPLALDPTAADYLARMQSGRATADELDDFGVLLGRKTYLDDAEAFVEAAVARDKKSTDYWLNLGTIRLQKGKLSSALAAYEEALELDPNKALTHYDIGVVHDYMRNYDRAIESFTRALAIDPSLGDPKVNPLAVNNERLLVVNLLLYQAKEGGLTMPLLGGPAVVPPPKPRPVEPKKSGS